MKGILILIALASLLAVVTADVVNTKFGKVSGYTSDTHKVWKGIPFAAPPVGPLRWQPPVNPQPWSGVKETTEYGNYCFQSSGGSEDCLFVNVWVPKNANLQKAELPVLAYIYGGSFTGGKTNDFDGEYLSGEDVIYVSFNYRVGALGFMYHPALADLNAQKTSGFYGMQDQRLALKWIRENIANFGGNPNKVTVSSESAGAISLCLHLATPRSNGLYDQIISQSGYCHTFTQAEGTNYGNYISENLNCSGQTTASCLYSKTPAQILAASSLIFVFYPTSHPYEIVDEAITVIESGNFNKVPIMGGTNLNESSYSLCAGVGGLNYDQAFAYVNSAYVPNTYAKNLTALMELYNPSNYRNPGAAVIAIATDRSFRCHTKTLFQAAAASVDVYMYSFERVPSFVQSACHGAAHAYELNFLYPLLSASRWAGLTTEERALSKTMRDAWAAFTAAGVPTLPNGNVWPKYTESEKYVIFDAEPQLSYGENFLDKYCPVWDLSTIHALGVTLRRPTTSYTPYVSPAYPNTCSVSITQSKSSSWKSGNVDYSQYNVNIRVGSQPVYALLLQANTNGASFAPWNIESVTASSNLYSLPDYAYNKGALAAGSTVSFGYTIASATPADLSVYNNACGPQACLASVSSALSGQWRSGNTNYKQYQITVTNNSPDTLASTTVQIDFTGGAYVQSSWNLSPSSSSPGSASQTFTCAVSNLAPGASSSSCGYVVASSTDGASQSASLSQTVCL